MKCVVTLITLATLTASSLGEDMKPYTQTIPGSDVTFSMVPIPGGKFKMGSPDGEAGRKADEGPQAEVEIEPLWVGKCEVTWAEFKEYMRVTEIFMNAAASDQSIHAAPDGPDAVTSPSRLYDPSFAFERGEDPQQPAATMNQYTAKQYCKWLSKITGQEYRLPTEAEWEYACRAGTTTAYYFGDDAKRLGDYEWFRENSNVEGTRCPHKVGLKKPNPWGLYDMHGNVAEYVADQYVEDQYKTLGGKSVKWPEAVRWPTELYPRAIRGGSVDMTPERCRSAARYGDAQKWQKTDPNRPRSPWWHTEEESQVVGFRIVRMNRPMTDAEKKHFWDADVPSILDDVQHRFDVEGKGWRTVADPKLPERMEKLEKLRKK